MHNSMLRTIGYAQNKRNKVALKQTANKSSLVFIGSVSSSFAHRWWRFRR